MVYCQQCGTQVGGESAFCNRCGAAVKAAAPYGYPPPQHTATNSLAIGALIAAFIFPIVGFILGIVALSSISKTGQRGRGLAIAGIIIGAVLSVLYLILFIVNIDVYRCLIQGTFDCWVCQLIF